MGAFPAWLPGRLQPRPRTAASVPAGTARSAPGVGEPQSGRGSSDPGTSGRAGFAGLAATASERGHRPRPRTPRRRQPRLLAPVPRRHRRVARGSRTRHR